MAFVFELDTEAAGQNGGNGKVKSGIHDVIIKGLFLGATKAGNNEIDIVVETKSGQKAVIFGMCIDKTWKTGSANVNYAKWNELAMISGISAGTIGKVLRKMNGADAEADAFIEATGKEVKMAIQQHFDVYLGEEKDTYQLVQTFGPQGHTVTEKMQNKPATRFETFKVEDYCTPEHKIAVENGTLKKSSSAPRTEGTEAPEVAPAPAATEAAPLF